MIDALLLSRLLKLKEKYAQVRYRGSVASVSSTSRETAAPERIRERRAADRVLLQSQTRRRYGRRS
jgi:hypothetical protein